MVLHARPHAWVLPYVLALVCQGLASCPPWVCMPRLPALIPSEVSFRVGWLCLPACLALALALWFCLALAACVLVYLALVLHASVVLPWFCPLASVWFCSAGLCLMPACKPRFCMLWFAKRPWFVNAPQGACIMFQGLQILARCWCL